MFTIIKNVFTKCGQVSESCKTHVNEKKMVSLIRVKIIDNQSLFAENYSLFKINEL